MNTGNQVVEALALDQTASESERAQLGGRGGAQVPVTKGHECHVNQFKNKMLKSECEKVEADDQFKFIV